MHTKKNESFRQRSDDLKSAGAENAGAEDLENPLASASNVRFAMKNKVFVHQDQEDMAKNGVRAWQKSVHLLARLRITTPFHRY